MHKIIIEFACSEPFEGSGLQHLEKPNCCLAAEKINCPIKTLSFNHLLTYSIGSHPFQFKSLSAV
jgi:hypothetical protein